VIKIKDTMEKAYKAGSHLLSCGVHCSSQRRVNRHSALHVLERINESIPVNLE
jgi:hypothetical protein